MGKLHAGVYEELSVYVRFHAWLNATHERPKTDKSDDPILTRLQRLRRDQEDEDYLPPFPPVEGSQYLLGYLWEFGPTMAGGGTGPAPVTHGEIRAWEELSGIELRPWEAKILRRLSLDYLAELRRAEKEDAPSPWLGHTEQTDFSAVAKGLQARMRALAAG